MKKIYMPNMDELYQMQDMGMDVYNYLVAKTVESIVLEGINYPNKGMLKNTYKYVRENLELTLPICYLYPSEMEYAEGAGYDSDLCLGLLKKKREELVNLDNLSRFSDIITFNGGVVEEVVNGLLHNLELNPNYRFTYQESNLINSIFNCELPKDVVYYDDTKFSLVLIEPAYALKFSELRDTYVFDECVDNYAKRYLIKPRSRNIYKKEDILTNPDQNVKRMLKLIKENR